MLFVLASSKVFTHPSFSIEIVTCPYSFDGLFATIDKI